MKTVAFRLAFVGLLLLPVAVEAEEFQLNGIVNSVGVGEAFTIEEGHRYWIGYLAGNYYDFAETGPFHNMIAICPVWNDTGAAAGGYCVFSNLAGEQAHAKVSCLGTIDPPEGTLLAADCTLEWTGGTGRFAGITGGGTYVATILNFDLHGDSHVRFELEATATLTD